MAISQTSDYRAFKPGEVLEYRIHYGLINAGYARFEVGEELKNINGKPHYQIGAIGRTTGGWDLVYKVRDYYNTYLDTKTLLPSFFIRNVTEGDYKKKESYIFMRNSNMLRSGDKEFAVPPKIHDILSALYYARCIDLSKLKAGDSLNMFTFLDDELFPVGATYTGTTTIKTKLGKFKVYIIKPKLIEGRIFKDQRDMTLYVSADKNQLPIRIESAIFVGYIQADLSEFQNLKYPLTSRVSQ